MSKLPSKQTVFFIHIMKTAGTSFRLMLEGALSHDLYPCTVDLERNGGRYLNTYQLVNAIADGVLDLTDRRAICGHYPFALAEEVIEKPFCATFLREPVERTLSLINHMREVYPARGEMSISEMLEDKALVYSELLDYQTKILALDNIYTNYQYSEANHKRALERIATIDFVGITEDFARSVKLFEAKTGFDLGDILWENQKSKPELAPSDRELIEDLVKVDTQIFEAAQKRFSADCEMYGIS